MKAAATIKRSAVTVRAKERAMAGAFDSVITSFAIEGIRFSPEQEQRLRRKTGYIKK